MSVNAARVAVTENAASPRHAARMVLIACTAQFVVVLDVSVVNVALPAMRTALDISSASLQWIVTAYTLAFGGFLLLGGRLADLFGLRRVLLTGLAVFTVASLVGGLAQHAGVLIGARAVQGLGAAVLGPISLTLVTTEFRDVRQRGRAIAAWSGVAAAGGAAGVLVGGAVTQFWSWRWTLLINVPITAVLFVAAWVAVADRRDRGAVEPPDMIGALLVTGGLVACVYGITTSLNHAWSWGIVGLGAVVLALFTAWEAAGARAPLVPLEVFRSRAVTLSNLVMFLTAASAFSMWYFLSLYLQTMRGFDALHTGLAFLPQYLTIVVGSLLASRALVRLGARPLLVAGALLQVIGFGWLSLMTPISDFLLTVLAPGLLVTFGLGLTSTPMTTTATAGVPLNRAGLASGLINTSRHLGGGVGLAVLATIVNHRAVTSTPASAFSGVFLVDAVVLAVAGAVALAIPSQLATRADSTSERSSM